NSISECLEHLSRDGHAFLSCGSSASRLSHAFANRFRDSHTGHLMVQELRIPIACKRKKTKEHWHLERCDIVQKFLHDAYVIDWLGHDELRSGFALQAESMKLSRIVRCPRLDSRGTEKGRRLSERLPTRIESMVQSAYQPEQANGIGVVDGRGIWKVAHL